MSDTRLGWRGLRWWGGDLVFISRRAWFGVEICAGRGVPGICDGWVWVRGGREVGCTVEGAERGDGIMEMGRVEIPTCTYGVKE